ncbi:MAG: hypothetical protein IPI91_16380 [Flavobacteriales bacterium]|nr:hypothetical protein [Flavobacteriales bacterium]
MRILYVLLLCSALGPTVVAQGVITRIGIDGTEFYYNGVPDLQTLFDDATDNGLGVDTVLLPGGQFLLTSNLDVTSPVIVIGSGIRADSAIVYGGRTAFVGSNASIFLHADADGSEMHGVSFEQGGNSPIYFGSTLPDSDVDNVRFVRCDIRAAALSYPNATSSLASNITFQECILNEALNVSGSEGVVVRSSIIHDIVGAYLGSNLSVLNNIVLDFDGLNGNGFNPNVLVNYMNNVFLTNSITLHVTENAIFSNNLFVGNDALFGQSVTFDPSITHTGTETAPSLVEAFPGVQSPVGYTTYQYTGDYTLALPYLGTDGTPLGVYGGDAPWKNGSLPFNPHWSLLTSPTNSTTNGVLQGVNIKASAQEN